MTCKKCKRICKLCEHFIQDNVDRRFGIMPSEPMCRASEHEEVDCVTGEKDTCYYLCREQNSDGQCKNFKLNVELNKRLKLVKVLQNRLDENRKIKGIDNYCHRDTLEDKLLHNLIYMLEHNNVNESPDFERIYIGYCSDEEDNEYENLYDGDYHFIIKDDGSFKKAVKKGKR